MSPLVALLALACAAPLEVLAEAQQQCTATLKGHTTSKMMNLPPVVIAKDILDGKVDIPDNCAIASMQLVGMLIMVCDDTRPIIEVPPQPPFSPVYVKRISQPKHSIHVVTVEYCE